MTDRLMNLPSCLICDRELKPVLTQLSDDRFYSPGTYDILRCCLCGLEQTWPQPNARVIRELYERYYNSDCEKEKIPMQWPIPDFTGYGIAMQRCKAVPCPKVFLNYLYLCVQIQNII